MSKGEILTQKIDSLAKAAHDCASRGKWHMALVWLNKALQLKDRRDHLTIDDLEVVE